MKGVLGPLTDGFLNITVAEGFLYQCFLGLGILTVSLSSERNRGFSHFIFFYLKVCCSYGTENLGENNNRET